MILTGVILAMLLSSLDQTIVATAMPTIVQELHGIEHLSWVFTAYMLGSTVTVPIYGKLSDIFSRRNLYLIAIIIFLISSVLCGLALNMTELILFRGLQGIGGGAMMVNSFAVIGDVFPPAERGKYQGMIGAVFGLSSVAGPLLGGWITDHTTWRWVFYVNIPVGVFALLVLSSALPKIKALHQDRTIDWLGAFFIVTTLIPLLLSLVWAGSLYAWSSWQIIGLLVFAAVSIIVFVQVEKKARNPIIALTLFQNKTFVVAALSMFLTAMAMFGGIIYIPLFSQGVIGGSATHAGLVLTPMMFSLVVASTISGQIISRTGKYKILAIVGTVIITGALFYFATLNVGTSNTSLIMRMIFLGLGLGSTMPIFTIAVQSAFAQSRIGEVTAASQLFRSVGGTVGTAILGGILNSSLNKQVPQLEQEPFAAEIRQFGLNSHGGGLDASMIQSVLNHTNRKHIEAVLQQVPGEHHTAVMNNFSHFIASAKVIFANAVSNIFLISGVLMIIALIVVFFLPEIPLRKSNRPALEDIGIELEDEFGHSDDESQPRAMRRD